MKKLLDLGCGIRKRKGAIGVDIIPNDVVDVIHNLNQCPWPFPDNEFDDILFESSIEHLNDIVKTLEETWRIAKPKARVTIKVSYFRSHYAIDPTHRHYFAAHSFYYFDPSHEYHRLYKYSDALFKVERIVFDDGHKYNWFNTIKLSWVRWIANRYPMRYEEYLAPWFPLHSLDFYLTVLK